MLTRRSSGFSLHMAAPSEAMSLENDVITLLSTIGGAYVYHTTGWWSQIKTAGAAIYSNRHCLKFYHKTHPERLFKSEKGEPKVIGDVFIHPSAHVHPTAVVSTQRKEIYCVHIYPFLIS